MAGIVKAKLSGSTDGEPVLITSTNSTGATTIHTFASGVSGENSWDEIYLWGFNNSTADINLTIEYGSTSHIIVHSIPYKEGMTLILPGTVGHNGLVLKGFKGATGTLGVAGFINRISS